MELTNAVRAERLYGKYNVKTRQESVSCSCQSSTVAWRGSIVINSREELPSAFEEYEEGAFNKNIPTSHTCGSSLQSGDNLRLRL